MHILYNNCITNKGDKKMSSKIINISIPDNLLKYADKVAKKESRNRSELFREALRSYLINRTELADLYAYGANQAKKTGIISKNLKLEFP